MGNYEKTRFTETQIVKAIQERENGRKAEDICRELQITTAAFTNGDWIEFKGSLHIEFIFSRYRTMQQ